MFVQGNRAGPGATCLPLEHAPRLARLEELYLSGNRGGPGCAGALQRTAAGGGLARLLSLHLTRSRHRYEVSSSGDVGSGVPAGTVPCSWIFSTAEQRRLPAGRRRVIFYVHGGGYYAGSVDCSARSASELSRRTGYSVFMPDYRLLPGVPWPSPMRDVLAAYAWLVSPLGGGVDAQNVVVAGESAGGAAAASIALECNTALKGRVPMPRGVCALSPYCDLTHDYASITERQEQDWVAM